MLFGVPVWVFFNRQMLLNKDQNEKYFIPPNASKEKYKIIKNSHS